MRVWVEFYDASNNKLGTGPVVVKSASVTRVLDGIGSIMFTVPATDARVRELVQARRRIKLFTDYTGVPTLLGEGVILRKERNHDSGGWSLSVDCADIMQELKDANTLLARTYEQQEVSAVVDDLVALAPGWAANIYDEDTLFEGRFDGVSALKALQSIATNNGLHMRLEDASRRLGFGAFGEDIGLTLINADSAMARGQYIAIIESMTLVEESEDIVNWMQPVGAGEGEAALTLKLSTREFVQSATVNGKTVYYVTDDASITAYGQVQKVVAFKDIAPIANSAAAKVNAANALADATYVELTRRAAPYKTLSISLQGTDRILRCGDKVRVLYLGAIRRVDGSTLDDDRVDGMFWITKVKERYNADGRSIQIEVSEIDELLKDEATVVMNAVEDMKLRNLKPQTYPTAFVYSYYDTVGAGKFAKFLLNIDEKITDILRVTWRVTTKPIWTSAMFRTGAPFEGIMDISVAQLYPTVYPFYIPDPDDPTESASPLPNSQAVGTLTDTGTWEFDVTEVVLELQTGGLYKPHKFQCVSTEYSLDLSQTGLLNPIYSQAWTSVPYFWRAGIVEAAFTVLATCQAVV